MKKSSKTSNKIVVKVGSSLLTGGSTSIVEANLSRIVENIVLFVKSGREVILVTSGAIACGLAVLGLKSRPKELELLQAAAAAGQNVLMQAYAGEFSKRGLKCAQVLLTREDFSDRQRYLNASNTINTLLKYGVVPVVNENDAISTDQIKFGDNDTLSARVAVAIEADGLLILSDVEGLFKEYDAKTKTYSQIVKRVDAITPEIAKLACGTDKVSCVGGMSTKITAAHIATSGGVPTVIAASTLRLDKVNFYPDTSEDYEGTLFVASQSSGKKKHWIAFEARVKGRLIVDDGAKKALVSASKSLLAPGVVANDGNFDAGDVVEIAGQNGEVFAKGKVNFSAGQLTDIKGKKGTKEVVHKDDLVLL